MSIENIENQPESVVSTTTDTNPADHDDSSPPQPLVSYNCRTRCKAGSDNCNQNSQYRGSVPQQNGRQANRGRPPIWEDQAADRLPPLRLVFRDQSVAQSNQPTPSRIPVPCPYRSEQPRRQDRPVDLYEGSRLPTPSRQGRQPARIPRENRRVGGGVQSQQQQTCGAAPSNNRRGTYDVPAQQRTCGAAPSIDRRGTYDVPAQQQMFGAAPPTDRRGTYDVPAQQRVCGAAPSANRRGTYDVPASQRVCGAAPSANRRGTYDVQPAPSSNATFTMTGTLLMEGFQEMSPVRQPPRDRSSSCSNRRNDTDAGIEAFLGNELNCDMVAPRSMAVPGQPYVRIDESGMNTTPDNWRRMMDNRSSIGSGPMGIMSPAYDDSHGSRDWRRTDDSGSTDTSRLNRWSSSDRQSRPFGLNDSFVMSGASTPCDRPSRARSAASDCGLPVRKNRCRRDTFDRNTR